MTVRLVLLRCRGHPDVQLYHSSTLEIETEERLTVRGDCIACVSCRGDVERLEEAASGKGLGKLVLAALFPWPPRLAWGVVDGLLPGERPGGRLVARKSCHRRGSLLVAASRSAAELPRELALTLSSGFARCLAVYASFTPEGFEEEVDAVYEAAGCVVENPEGSEGGSPRGES